MPSPLRAIRRPAAWALAACSACLAAPALALHETAAAPQAGQGLILDSLVPARGAAGVQQLHWRHALVQLGPERGTLGLGLTAAWPLPATAVAATRHGGPGLQPLADSLADGAASLPPRGELRMGLSFSRRGPHDALRRSLAWRMELSGSTTLTVKPRAGRVNLQLSSQW
ncbi:hypothetical protein [Aquabacterium sp. OR-4]|uniref:hypothetical protein n=1 Tax=Aquabacterium sp. OR-4 TaxID=2978127 RepID=UPI0021B3E7F3|nr:hypothetical protein [Aquabacterium sp. OR-4]MDT7835092.1 hypothetical protein [Aquabacterium sp. OR-4]